MSETELKTTRVCKRMMFCWCALVLLTLVPAVTSNYPGVKVKLTQKGLDYGVTVAVNSIKNMLKTMTIPDIPIPLYTIKELKIQSWDNFKPAQKIDSTGVTITVNVVNLRITGNWAPRDPFELTLNTLDISATAAVKTDETGHLTLSIGPCDARIGHFSANPKSRLVEGLSRVNSLLSIFLRRKICSMMKNTINDYNTKLATFNDELIGSAGVDFLMGPTVISRDRIEFSLKDIFFYLGQEKKTYPSPTDFTLPSQNAKMLYIGISTFTINSFLADFYKSGLLGIRIFDDMVPSWILTTTTFGAYIPEISAKYPDQKMMLEIQTAKEPAVKFEANSLVLEILCTFTAFVIKSDTEQTKLFALNLGGKISFQENAEKKQTLTLDKIEASIKENNMKSFEVTKLNTFLDMVMKSAVFPLINAHLAKGYPLPCYPLPYSFGDIHLVNAQVECIPCANKQGYLLFGTDVHVEENPSPEHSGAQKN